MPLDPKDIAPWEACSQQGQERIPIELHQWLVRHIQDFVLTGSTLDERVEASDIDYIVRASDIPDGLDWQSDRWKEAEYDPEFISIRIDKVNFIICIDERYDALVAATETFKQWLEEAGGIEHYEDAKELPNYTKDKYFRYGFFWAVRFLASKKE